MLYEAVRFPKDWGTGQICHPGNIPGSHSCHRLSRLQGHSAARRISQPKILIIPTGNEPTVPRLLTQCLHQLHHRVPRNCEVVLFYFISSRIGAKNGILRTMLSISGIPNSWEFLGQLSESVAQGHYSTDLPIWQVRNSCSGITHIRIYCFGILTALQKRLEAVMCYSNADLSCRHYYQQVFTLAKWLKLPWQVAIYVSSSSDVCHPKHLIN
jgi:hypothetical protein